MNKNIKEIVEGAMFLGLYGTLLIVDRYLFGSLMNVILYLFLTVMIIAYGIRNPKSKYLTGMIIGVIVLILLFGDMMTWIFSPLGIVSGLVYVSLYLNKVDNRRIFYAMLLIFVIYEVLIGFIAKSLFLIPIEESINSIQSIIKYVVDHSKNINAEMINIYFSKHFALIMIMLSFLINGVLEAIVVTTAAKLFLKKQKYPLHPRVKFEEYHLPFWLSYLLFVILLLGIFSLNKINNYFLFCTLLLLTFLSAVVLLFYGYGAIILYFKNKFNINVGLFIVIAIILLKDIVLFVLVNIGFLYLTSPLKRYILRN